MRMIAKLFQLITIATAFLVMLTCSANAQEATPISKADVQAVLNSIDNGVLKKDAGAVIANFASNAVITATISEGGRKDTTKQDAKGYRQALEAGFKSFDNYIIKRKDVTIEVAPDGKSARSNSALLETYRFNGKMQQGLTKESATFERVGTKVLIVKMHSEVTVE